MVLDCTVILFIRMVISLNCHVTFFMDRYNNTYFCSRYIGVVLFIGIIKVAIPQPLLIEDIGEKNSIEYHKSVVVCELHQK